MWQNLTGLSKQKRPSRTLYASYGPSVTMRGIEGWEPVALPPPKRSLQSGTQYQIGTGPTLDRLEAPVRGNAKTALRNAIQIGPPAIQ
jgi:hypothetical protein